MNLSRVGEENINSFGSRMIIKKYKNNKDIDVYFPEYDWVAKNTQYGNFKKGNIKCPYEKRYFNIGYLGEGKYNISENGKTKREFVIWYNMLQRCYDPKLHKRYTTYEGKIPEPFYSRLKEAMYNYKVEIDD